MGYPTSVNSFTTKNTGDTIQPAHVNDLQTEVTAVETDLLAAWTSVAFNAANFTGNGSMTWTVGAGDQTTFAYKKTGKVMTIMFWLDTTTVGGTPSTALQIAIPGGVLSARASITPVLIIDNSARSIGYAQLSASGSVIQIVRADGTNWSASTNATYVMGTVTFETS